MSASRLDASNPPVAFNIVVLMVTGLKETEPRWLKLTIVLRMRPPTRAMPDRNPHDDDTARPENTVHLVEDTEEDIAPTLNQHGDMLQDMRRVNQRERIVPERPWSRSDVVAHIRHWREDVHIRPTERSRPNVAATPDIQLRTWNILELKASVSRLPTST